MSFAIIVIAETNETPELHWCGYEPNPAQPGAGCHRWLPGTEGLKKAVKFIDVDNAMKAGVGAPNTPYGRGDLGPYRGVIYSLYDDNGRIVHSEIRDHGT